MQHSSAQPWLPFSLLALLACLALPAPSSAQIPGVIKKKIKEAAGQKAGEAAAGALAGKADTSAAGKAKAAAPGAPQQPSAKAAPAGPSFDERVLELTPANLDRLEKGLLAEKAYRDSVQRFFASLPRPEQWSECKSKAMQTPELKKLNEPLLHDADMATIQRAVQEVNAAVEKRCGPNPADVHRPPEYMVAGTASDRAAAASGLTQVQLSIMHERVAPFCTVGGAARIPGRGTNIFYVYSAAEVEALTPRCAKLKPLMS